MPSPAHRVVTAPQQRIFPEGPDRRPVREVFGAFLKLGLTSFGGPIAHLGYYREEFVLRRRWIDEAGYADLVALCQFLPGPASSQAGFALGLMRAGYRGALAAWAAFTLPSALVMVLFAFGLPFVEGKPGEAALHGLKIVPVAVVGQAVWGMARSLCPDRPRAAIALTAILLVVLAGGTFAQIGAIFMGGLAGLWLCRQVDAAPLAQLPIPISRRAGAAALAVFFLLLVLLPVAAARLPLQELRLFDAFYRAGALVFGGGHVVLPLLEAETVSPGWISRDAFLAGYGAAQAIPGPLFTFAAYVGAAASPEPNGWIGAALCLAAIFLPGLLLVLGVLPFWGMLRAHSPAQAALRGTNAAVVGLLGAALYDPLWTGAIRQPSDFAIAVTGFALLTIWRTPPWIVVIMSVGASAALAAIGWQSAE